MTLAGRLDRRVKIFKRTLSKSSSGQSIETFAELFEVWARLLPVSAGELVKSESIHAKQTVIWELRYRKGIEETYQLRYEGKIYKITGVQETKRRELLQLTTELYE